MLYSEKDLIIPTLNILSRSPIGIKTEDLIPILIHELAPEWDDLTILSWRKDTKFSQKVRNLNSHKTLEKKWLAVFEKWFFKITSSWYEYLINHSSEYTFLLTNGFSEEQRSKVIENDFEDFISEWESISYNVTIRKRSKKLVDFAKRYYRKWDDIYCEACNFSFYKFYWSWGEWYIEIHHKIPIFMSDETEWTLSELVKNVTPLCANCHRMVHRKSNDVLSSTQLQSFIHPNLFFQWKT